MCNLLQQFQETKINNYNLIYLWITAPSLLFTHMFLIENYYTLVSRSNSICVVLNQSHYIPLALMISQEWIHNLDKASLFNPHLLKILYLSCWIGGVREACSFKDYLVDILQPRVKWFLNSGINQKPSQK